MSQDSSSPASRGTGDGSPAARNLAEWFRQLDRYVRMTCTFGPAAPNCTATRERVLEDFMEILGYHAPFAVHCTPLELWLRDEAIVRPPAAATSETVVQLERRIPFLLYRDGIRALTFTPKTTREDVGALLDALAKVTTAQVTNEDLVTLLWEVNLTGLRVDISPLEAPAEPGGGLAAAFDDWAVPQAGTDVLEAWRALTAAEAHDREAFTDAWRREAAEPWTMRVDGLVRGVMALDPSPNTVDAFGHALVTWLGGAVQRCEWDEAGRALAALQAVDPAGERTAGALSQVFATLDAEAVAERLDEAEPGPQARFFALAVRLGRPALDLLVGVLAIATRVRLRAAATTALSYLCAEEPELLGRHLADPRWYVVRNIVFVLGQIGGPGIVELLARIVQHPDARVRRSVVHALGQAPSEMRLPLLVELLDSADPQTVSAALVMLGRESDPRVGSALLERVTADDFAERPDEAKVALVTALGETTGESALPVLEELLHRGGWFARRAAERSAAAQALVRIGTPAALTLVETGLSARAEAIRVSCQDALARKGRAA
ncbi:MAG: HEAT repeat domain-containing protein [Candidatus Eisenbacteria bacterium]|nr:HEAT repeat domain-containing protein [Candidatus Eisenbacteria bacterium]